MATFDPMVAVLNEWMKKQVSDCYCISVVFCVARSARLGVGLTLAVQETLTICVWFDGVLYRLNHSIIAVSEVTKFLPPALNAGRSSREKASVRLSAMAPLQAHVRYIGGTAEELLKEKGQAHHGQFAQRTEHSQCVK